ncbi:MAG: ABC transporter permease [Acidimicrobiales bacterium]
MIAIAGQQLQSLRRQRVMGVLFATMVAMTAAAGLIGWSSHVTIVRVYDEAVRLLAAEGKPAPPNPFALKPTLSQLSNMAVYTSLVGGLLALVLGHLSFADDQSEGVGRLIFSREVSRAAYARGKVVGAAVSLGAVVVASMAVSAVGLLLVNRSLSGADLGRLTVFFALSWLFLLVFAMVGMVTTLMSRRRSLGLLWALGVWLVMTFALPQLTSGLRPVASLNPVVDPVSTSQTFFKVSALARPISVTEQYKNAAGRILRTGHPEPGTTTAVRVAPIAGLVVVLAAGVELLVRRHDYSRPQPED